ncbi:hypothetical protein [Streptomyces sp. NPDC002187]|uniref:hypothetical protein n=1 Tax=Streptomyces sp. NPDC002187 TaxID=3364637 RepID=UPI0036A72957
MDKGAISRDDILKTLAEYDDLTRDVFLETFGYGKASTYLLLHDGKEYDSRAVAGVAHKHQHGRALTNDELSGGLDATQRGHSHHGFVPGVAPG